MTTKDKIGLAAAVLIVLALVGVTAWTIISEATKTVPIPAKITKKKQDGRATSPAPNTIKRDLMPRIIRRQKRTAETDTWPTQIDVTAQKQAELEVLYMAEHDIRDHVSTTIGDFEGAGFATHGNTPPTCEPTTHMILIADAQACGEKGCYRVRAWKNP